ncbi:MAG: ribosome maturation factor RimP [Endomicrobium sp.]|jgi:ribosome maturation factor RimP|nr:ribosome maturation factor RimP [Endomicrobium sp.]
MQKELEIEEYLSKKLENTEIEIINVEYVKENGSWILRIFIDKDGGVNMNDCEKASLQFSKDLDENPLLNESYVLEVSSPGINRILKKEKDFKKFIGSTIRVQTIIPIGNQKNFLGKLLSFDNNIVKINDVTNGIKEIEFSNIKKTNIETEDF